MHTIEHRSIGEISQCSLLLSVVTFQCFVLMRERLQRFFVAKLVNRLGILKGDRYAESLAVYRFVLSLQQ